MKEKIEQQSVRIHIPADKLAAAISKHLILPYLKRAKKDALAG